MKINQLIGTSVLAFLAASGTSALAQPVPSSSSEAPSEVDEEEVEGAEILVFGRLRGVGESVQKVPIAITALDSEMLRAANSIDIADLGSLAPNVQTPLVGNTAAFPNFSIRGIGVNTSLRSVDPAVNIIQDGMVIAFQAGALASTFDLEGVEILRGPQGVLFGRNATGGAIALRTRRPGEDFRFYGYASYGNFNTVDINASVEGALAGPNILGKLAVIYRRSDGFVKNTNQGTFVPAPGNPSGAPVLHEEGYVGALDQLTIKPTFQLDFSDATKLVIFTQYQRFNDDGASGPRNFVPPPGNTTVPLQTQFGFTPPTGKYTTNLLDPGYLRLRAGHVIGELTNELGAAQLVTIAAYRRINYDATSPLNGSPFVLFITPDNRDDNKQISLESRLNVPFADDKFEFLLGGFYLRAETDVEFFSITTNAPANPLTRSYATAPFSQDTVAHAAFANLDWHLTDRLTISAGGRYSTEEKDFTGSPNTPCIGESFANCPQTFTNVKKRWNNFSPRFVANYELDNLLLYASYVEGFRSGNFNSRVRVAAGFTPANPESVASYEVGLKSTLFDRALRLNLSAFQSDYKDIQQVLTTSIGGAASVQSLFNAASARIKGLEAEIVVRPVRGLQLETNLGYTDAKFRTFTIPVAGVGDATKLRFARIPKYTASVAAQYTHDMSDDRSVNGRIAYDWKSSYVTDLQNTPALEQGSYGLLNASLTYEQDGWSVGIFGRNLTNVEYFDLGSRSVAYVAYGGQARTYGIRASFEFN